jgi:hypothetical protein
VGELSEAELDELVEQAVVDAYGDDEQMTGLYTMIEDNLALPFTTTVLGVEANVAGVDLTDSGIVAICTRKRLDELARDPEAAWAEAERLISTRAPAQYDAAVALLKDLHELARRPGEQSWEFGRRYAALREADSRKPSLITRLDRAGLTAV